MFFILLREALHRLDDSSDLLIISRFIKCLRYMVCVGPQLSELFSGKSEMTTGAGTFYHNEIRRRMIFSVPHPADHKS